MARTRTVVIDEIHLTVRVPAGLPDDENEEIRDVLAGDEFMARLRHAVRAVVREFPALAVIRVSLTR